jgi:hypothetical protein
METIFTNKNNAVFNNKNSAKKWDVTPEKYLTQSEQAQLIRATEGKSIIDLLRAGRLGLKSTCLLTLPCSLA